MPITRVGTLIDRTITVYNPVAGTPAGSKVAIPSPFRGQIMEAGFVPNSNVTSGMTLAVAINNSQLSSAASNYVEVVTSTLGTFSSTNLYHGAAASVIPTSPAVCNMGDSILFTTSGGQSSTVGATVYAVVRGL